MEDPSQVEELRNRDLHKYGDPDGPSFQYLIQQATELGLKGDKMYEAIIEGSFMTNADVNRRFNVEWAGLNADRKEKLSKWVYKMEQGD